MTLKISNLDVTRYFVWRLSISSVYTYLRSQTDPMVMVSGHLEQPFNFLVFLGKKNDVRKKKDVQTSFFFHQISGCIPRVWLENEDLSWTLPFCFRVFSWNVPFFETGIVWFENFDLWFILGGWQVPSQRRSFYFSGRPVADFALDTSE